jgi:hypothetical protein
MVGSLAFLMGDLSALKNAYPADSIKAARFGSPYGHLIENRHGMTFSRAWIEQSSRFICRSGRPSPEEQRAQRHTAASFSTKAFLQSGFE